MAIEDLLPLGEREKEAIRSLAKARIVRIRFDGPPGPEAPRFVETEDDRGRGIRIGRWEADPKTDDWFLILGVLPDEGS